MGGQEPEYEEEIHLTGSMRTARKWKKMKESAAGDDEVTINMLRCAGAEAQKLVVSMVQRYWLDPEGWDEEAHLAVVIPLFKQADRSQLKNYRGICLLTIISRLVAKGLASRLLVPRSGQKIAGK